MNRFSTLSAAIGIAAAALLAQPLAAQAAGAGHPAIGGGMRSIPVMDPLPGHGIVVDPIVGRPVLNDPNGGNPVTPIQKAPIIEHGDAAQPVLSGGNSVKPVLGGGNSVKPVLGGGNAVHLIPVDPIPLPRRPVLGTPKKVVPVPVQSEKP